MDETNIKITLSSLDQRTKAGTRKVEANANDWVTFGPHLSAFIFPGLLKRVLSFIVCIPDESRRECSGDEMHKIMQSCRDLPRVNKSFHASVRELMNEQVKTERAVPGVTAAELASIKAKAMHLELDSIGEKFLMEAQKTWGEKPGGLLATIFTHFKNGRIGYAKVIAKEYRKMLVVKCVELLSADRARKNTAEPPVNSVDLWTEKCVPIFAVGMFWRAHMLSPKKYATDCRHLIGEIIDTDAGYVSPESIAECSDYERKKAFLFAFEKHFPTGEMW